MSEDIQEAVIKARIDQISRNIDAILDKLASVEPALASHGTRNRNSTAPDPPSSPEAPGDSPVTVSLNRPARVIPQPQPSAIDTDKDPV